MTPKHKAKELVDKMMYEIMYNCQPTLSGMVAKQCALIACKFALENPLNSDGYNKYLNEIINEIELL